LDYKVLERTEKYSLAEVRLHTGRTHQIRVQMAGISHPVFGDMRYGGALAQKGKLALWAYSLSFTHPITKERMKFVAYPSETETPWKEFKFNDLLPVKA
jgi:23S rRNA pseudouridine1911/1915/1917 synthase